MPKKLTIKHLRVLIFFAASLSFITGCALTDQKAAESTEIETDINILRVGVTPNAPPLIFKKGREIVGLEADFAKELAKYLGKSLRFVELEWEDQIPALLDNRTDIIMSGMTQTPLREVRIAFTRRYLESGQMALIRREDSVRFSTGIFSLATSSGIGVVKNTFGEYFVDERFSTVKKEIFSSPQAAAKAVIDKDIDMFIYDAPMILYMASENEDKGLTALFALLTRENLAWGVRKDNTALLESANSFLSDADNQKMLKEMTQYWVPFAR
ncbi:MAG: transporter substrate-binding domain-containing protein [Desulfobacterales bacterium]|jgi:ABC-type amino acid transport substrate-binding protein